VDGETPVVEQVRNWQTTQYDECVGQEPAVTSPPQALGTHHCHSGRVGDLDERVEAGMELRAGHVIGVGPKRLVA
jgi:hypothetical protein